MNQAELARPPLISRSVVAIAAASFLSDLGHETATAALPAFLTLVLAAPPIALGLIEGSSDLLAAAAKLYGGSIAARARGLRGWAAAGYATTAIATGLMAAAPSWPWLLLIRPLAWTGRGWRGPIRNLLLTLSVRKDQFGRAFGLERAGDNAGAVFAPLLTLGLVAAFSYRTMFLLAAVPGFLAAGCYLLVRRIDAPVGTYRLRLSGYPRAFNRLLLAAGIFGTAQFAGSLFTLRAIQVLTPLSGARTGVAQAIALYFVYNLFSAVVAYPVGALADRTFRRRELLVVSFLAFSGAALFAAAASINPWLLLPAVALGGSGAAASEVAQSALAGDQLPAEQRGAGFGILAGVNGAGDFVASVWVTLVWTATGAPVAFLAAAAVAVVSAALAATVR